MVHGDGARARALNATRRSVLALAAPAAACASGSAAEADPTWGKPTIADAAWLTGRWLGEGFGAQLEETWSPPVGGQMVGHFRMARDDAPMMYELLLLEQSDQGLRYRVKHFNPDFLGWEERDAWHAFAPVSVSSEALRFDGLTLLRIGEDRSDHILRQRTQEGAERDVVLRYRRA